MLLQLHFFPPTKFILDLDELPARIKNNEDQMNRMRRRIKLESQISFLLVNLTLALERCAQAVLKAVDFRSGAEQC